MSAYDKSVHLTERAIIVKKVSVIVKLRWYNCWALWADK